MLSWTDCASPVFFCKGQSLMVLTRFRGKTIPVTGCGNRQRRETSRLPHFLFNRPTDGGKFVSLKRRAPFTLKKNLGTHFCYMLSRPQGHSAAGRIRLIEKLNNLVGDRTPDLPVCRIVPQATTIPRAPTRL
jgi:hypothetical protein